MKPMPETTNTSEVKYGFYDRLKSEFPSQIIVDATEICNLACVHCPHPTFKKSEHFSGAKLSLELNKKMVDEVKENSKFTQYIRYTSNGEPLVHPHIYEMLQYAVDHSNTFVTITTNAKIMNQDRIRKLFDSGLHLVDISIDAFKPETYAAIRVGGNLEVTRNNVLNLIRMKKELNAKTNIVVSFVEQPNNMSEVQDFKKYWESEGADYVVIRRLHSAAGGVSNIADDLRRQGDKQKRYPCLYPWERILLNPRGELAFCPQDWTHGSAIAPYETTTIKETWQGEYFQKLREAHLKDNFSKHAFCGQCPDWQQTRWPGQGRSYADMVTEFKTGKNKNP
jgi:MoaA/NifB/PqqE/SkfB family radical SAM enzyme